MYLFPYVYVYLFEYVYVYLFAYTRRQIHTLATNIISGDFHFSLS